MPDQPKSFKRDAEDVGALGHMMRTELPTVHHIHPAARVPGSILFCVHMDDAERESEDSTTLLFPDEFFADLTTDFDALDDDTKREMGELMSERAKVHAQRIMRAEWN